MTTLDDQKALVAFVEKAALSFREPAISTFGDLDPGSFLAIRWGLCDDCVLVVKLDPDFMPMNFQQAIKKI